FISVIVLRYKKPNVERLFVIPGGNVGVWVVALMGMMGSTFGFVFAFFPPDSFDVGHLMTFEGFLIGATIFFCTLPLLIYRARKPEWVRK
ncbi:MAG: hypothetical protein RL235_429, partial [Chlamydiota bacterium]